MTWLWCLIYLLVFAVLGYLTRDSSFLAMTAAFVVGAVTLATLWRLTEGRDPKRRRRPRES